MERKKTSKMCLKIRKAHLNDLDKIIEVERASFGHPYSKKFLTYLLKREGQINLVAEDKEIIGYSSARIEGKLGHILSIAVRPNRRREGIGTKLMQATLNSLQGKCKSLFLEVRESNKKGQKFYSALSFKKKGVKENYYANGENAIIYRKTFR